MSVTSAQVAALFNATEQIDGVPSSSSPDVNHNVFSKSQNLGPATNPPVSEVYAAALALAAGAATIDLTALDVLNESAVDMTGKKVNVTLLANPDGNAAITIVAGASNGYNILGVADGKLTLNGGDYVLIVRKDTLDEIGSTDAEIDISGTGTETLNVQLGIG